MRVCGKDGCPTLTDTAYCPAHTRRSWSGSGRRDKVQSKYRGASGVRRAKRVLAKHGTICHLCGQPGATEVDHITPLAFGGADDETNLAPIHVACHRAKTASEAAQARRRS